MSRRDLVKGALGLAAVSMAPGLLAQGCSWNQTMLEIREGEPLTSFAFGSCNRSTSDQSYWRTIMGDAPSLWIWMGDNIYANNYSTAARMARYDKMKNGPSYTAFRNLTPIIGTWDDHDFYDNDRDGQWDGKEGSKQAAMEFLDMDPARVDGHSGIYQSYVFGPEGKRTKVILLDLRFNMVQRRGKPSQLLGNEQWQWLWAEIFRNDFELLVIGSSQNVFSPSGAQSWASFPKERDHLYAMLKAVEQPVLFLSGDRHHGDFSKLNIGEKTVYEFMSSGLTHANFFSRSNRNRVGKPVTQKNYGIVSIDWDNPVPKLTCQLKSPTSGKVLQEMKI